MLWSLRSTPNQAIGEAPFSFVYGTETVLLAQVGISTYRQEQHKLSLKWVGPYHIRRTLGPGTYELELEDLDGKPIARTWHASRLCKYYV
ncbi:hypothetical protein LIER_17954 [Lithospermum erythrorhizon]|uniref:Tf2-1-like SH3-like domain-containing protein n=1 Tax=Lithospermum erythrorhizon TaxID=34254 RepID=A0AAV3QDZ5_LITER